MITNFQASSGTHTLVRHLLGASNKIITQNVVEVRKGGYSSRLVIIPSGFREALINSKLATISCAQVSTVTHHLMIDGSAAR